MTRIDAPMTDKDACMHERIYYYDVKVYYEDTDVNGHVNHVNYMNYFSRAREELIGFEKFAHMVNVDRNGIAIYNANIKFRAAARFGDKISIQSQIGHDGDYRLNVHQEAYIIGQPKPCVIGDFELICIDVDSGNLKKFPSLY